MYRKIGWAGSLLFILIIAAIGISACDEQPASSGPPEDISTNTQTTTATPPGDVPDSDGSVPITNTATPTRIPSETQTLPPATGSVVPLSGDGSVRITDGAYNYFLGSLNPEQTEMIAIAEKDSIWRLVRIDPDQGGLIEFIPEFSVDFLNPQVSPNGTYILVASNFDGDYEIYVLNYQSGAYVAKITENFSNDTFPDWFPDSNRFVFISDDGDREITMSSLERFSGDQAPVQLTFNNSEEYSPHVSLDGETIVYYSSRDNNIDIYVYAMKDGTEERITTDRARDAEGTFSPDGEWIVFESDRAGNYDIWAVRTDGSDLQQVTSDSAHEQVPYFSHDGEWLFYQRSEDDGFYDIYRIPWDK
ncbi:MAG: PD40 domain-containing protein [Anaerolineales bacterium]|nr:PD40 domain-containing protein [Anaerolineales bacterium]